ncbi:hypothetical protein [Nocardia wallacei]|uniref:hypothetical protein n=1 Tax=Nocardia wallacei TaxID=480035 RepID=UPI0024571569|nr:hypothetical protein [Nocardia wallacei]
MRNVSPEFADEIAALYEAREAAFAALRAANASSLTGQDMDAMVTAMAEIDERCEDLRRRFFPRRHRLVVTSGGAMLMSKANRHVEIVWTAPRRKPEVGR